MIRTLLWIFLTACVGTTAFAGGKDDEPRDDDDEGPWTVSIPRSMRGKGYVLQLDDDEVPLDGDKVTIKSTDRRREIRLTDKGRILASKEGYAFKDILEELKPRTWRLGLFMGGTTVNGKAFRKLLQDSRLEEISYEVGWQPEALGLEFQLARQTSEQDHSYGITSEYESNRVGFNALYEMAPFRHGSLSARRIHALMHAGLFSAAHKIDVGDGLASITDACHTTGGLLGLDLLYNIESVWFGVRGYYSVQHLEFKSFDFKTNAVERSLQFGGAYVF